MKKRLIALFLLAFLPTISQIIAGYYESYGVGLIVRIFNHLIVPIVAVSMILKISIKDSFLLPLKPNNKKQIIKHALIGSIGAIVIIISGFLIFRSLLDFSAIKSSLDMINVTKITYPFVALAIVLINPFMEEYFWRGFVYRVFDKYWRGYWTGILFAIHHMIIIAGWFNWWQFLIVTVFLSIVGIYFNYLYKKTGSIYSSLIIHTFADLVIVIIGFIVIF